MCSSEWKVCLSHHCVLIIKLNDNNGRVISQFAGLSEQLHVLKNQQLVPSWTQRLRQHLRGETFCPSVFMQMEKALVKKSSGSWPLWPDSVSRRRLWRRDQTDLCCQQQTGCELGTCGHAAGRSVSLGDVKLITKWTEFVSLYKVYSILE